MCVHECPCGDVLAIFFVASIENNKPNTSRATHPRSHTRQTNRNRRQRSQARAARGAAPRAIAFRTVIASFGPMQAALGHTSFLRTVSAYVRKICEKRGVRLRLNRIHAASRRTCVDRLSPQDTHGHNALEARTPLTKGSSSHSRSRYPHAPRPSPLGGAGAGGWTARQTARLPPASHQTPPLASSPCKLPVRSRAAREVRCIHTTPAGERPAA